MVLFSWYLKRLKLIISSSSLALSSILNDSSGTYAAAIEAAAKIIAEINSLNRQVDIAKSSQALSYLKKELSKTSLVEIKRSINQLIESQLETQMLAKINEDYSLIILETPFVPERKSKPNWQYWFDHIIF